MSLRDDLAEIRMDQTKVYKEEEPGSKPKTNSKDINAINEEILGGEEKDEANPFKKKKEGSSGFVLDKKMLIFGGGTIGVIILVIAFYFGFNAMNKDEGAAFLEELEEGAVSSFQYTLEERELLRTYGFTGDDIERYQAEERDPNSLIVEVEEARKKVYDEEMKPILDGASPKYKELEKMTWLGTGEMDPAILTNAEGSYEERYGTYNCDFTKVKPMGSQLFLKLDLAEFGESIFMTVTPERYNELAESGNIVIVIEYNKYANESILVTNVQEKDIKS